VGDEDEVRDKTPLPGLGLLWGSQNEASLGRTKNHNFDGFSCREARGAISQFSWSHDGGGRVRVEKGGRPGGLGSVNRVGTEHPRGGGTKN